MTTTSRRVAYGAPRAVEVAVCNDEDCAWTYRAATSAQLLVVAERHVRFVGHSVTVRASKELTLRPEER
jgi:hypothetical protein